MIVPLDLPADERSLPLDLTGESSVFVGKIHSEFCARSAYAITNAGIIEAHLIELRRTAKLLRAGIAIRHRGDKKYELDAEAMMDKPIKEVEDAIAKEEAVLKMLDAVIAGYAKVIEGASREMSRRSNERTSRGD